MNPDDLDRALLDRYLSGECSAAEAESVRQWLAADEANFAGLKELRDIREVMGSRTTWDVSQLWQRTADAIARAEPDGVFAERQPSAGHIEPDSSAVPSQRRFAPIGQPRRRHWWKVAAVVVTMAGAGTLWRMTQPERPPAVGPAAAVLREYATARGQVAKVALPDGSVALLSAASRLRVPTDFDRSRAVYLEGEARFVVPPRQNRAFYVYAGGLVTRDLSTEFGVRAYPGEAVTRVVVNEGSVAVRDAIRPRAPASVLDAGDVLVRTGDESVSVERGVDVAPYSAWTRHELVFRGVPVRDVLRELSHWYDLEFEIVDSSLAARRMSATLAANGVTAEVLALLAAAGDMRVEYRGRVAVFTPISGRTPVSNGATPRPN